jgi:protein-S-isoprenylcysteine O-methyltransferase Ste14
MTPYRWLILALWLGLIICWVVSAAGAKRSLGRRRISHEVGLRLIVVALIVIVLGVPAVRHALRDVEAYQAHSAVLGVVGVVLCAAGVGVAILARVHIGRNWGLPLSRKENPELVTSGPYGYVRHPIYSGILLAMLGTAIGASVFFAVPLIPFGGYFVYCARREEEIMVAQFPEQYPAYRRGTGMLLPLIL